MNSYNMEVLTNVIGAVESGGQIYGKRDYSAYAPPYANSPIEHTITLGWAQNYGAEARHLIQMIYEENKAAFKAIDTAGIESMLSKDWVTLRWNPTTAQKNALIRLISSDTGKKCQDKLFSQLMNQFISDCEAKYTKDVKAIMMYCEMRHLGGKKPAERIFDRCENYSLDAILVSLVKDQNDNSSNNQIGDVKFWGRHLKCKQFIEQYVKDENETDKENGWFKIEGGYWYYKEDGKEIRNTWKFIDGRWYAFDDGGRMIAGWHQYKNQWYYLNPDDGAMIAGQWLEYKNGWYYLKKDGTMAKDTYITDIKGRGYCYVDFNGKWDGKYVSEIPQKALHL